MKTSPKMKTIVMALADKHKVDLRQVGAYFRLDMPGYDRLCVENIGFNRIIVAHYFEQQGDLVAEPDIVFFVDGTGDWFPIEITQSLTGWTQYVLLSEDSTRVVRYNRVGQRDLAEFAEMWAENIHNQGWLERGEYHES